MVMALYFVACLTLTALPQIMALRQSVHDKLFQPDYVLRITQQEALLACRTRLSALINGKLNSLQDQHY